MKALAVVAVCLAIALLGGTANAQGRKLGSSTGSDTCTGASCAIGPGGISTDGGVTGAWAQLGSGGLGTDGGVYVTDTGPVRASISPAGAITGTTLTATNTSGSTQGVAVQSNTFVCFDGAACTRGIKYNSGGARFDVGASMLMSGTFDFTGRTFNSTATSGNNAVSVATNGARIDVGAGSNDYLASDGTTITTPGAFSAPTVSASTVVQTPTINDFSPAARIAMTASGATTYTARHAASWTATAHVFQTANAAGAGGRLASFADTSTVKLAITKNGALSFTGAATGSLATCGGSDAPEGTLQYDTTLHKLVVCTGSNWETVSSSP